METSYLKNWCVHNLIKKFATGLYAMCVLPAFLFPIRIPDFFAKYWSLYADVFVIPSK